MGRLAPAVWTGLVAISAMVMGCGGRSEPDPEVALGDRTGCDPIDPSVCALPWPSSYFEEPAQTGSGVTLAFWPESLPVNRDFVPLRPDAFNERDGFSTATPMLVWLGDGPSSWASRGSRSPSTVCPGPRSARSTTWARPPT